MPPTVVRHRPAYTMPSGEDFGKPLPSGIPRVIHQTWENTSIPNQVWEYLLFMQAELQPTHVVYDFYITLYIAIDLLLYVT